MREGSTPQFRKQKFTKNTDIFGAKKLFLAHFTLFLAPLGAFKAPRRKNKCKRDCEESWLIQ